jgi:uncharacterized protein YjbI with pentapeptide repeats
VEQEQQTIRRRMLSFIRELVPDWRPTRKQLLWTIRIIVMLVLLLGILTIIGLPFGISLWDWVKLLIVPAVIAGGGIWFNRQQRERELEVADQRAQDEALQSYLDQISQLLTDREHQMHEVKPGDSLRAVAQARTLTILTRLDGRRKGSVLQFLYETGLIIGEQPVLSLSNADLHGAALHTAEMSEINLDRANLSHASFTNVNFNGAFLREANLHHADLAGVNLSNATLRNADLSKANLAVLEVDKGVFYLSQLDRLRSGQPISKDLPVIEIDQRIGVNVGGKVIGIDVDRFHLATNLSAADLTNVDLREANLRDIVGVTNTELFQQTYSLKGATMPDGSIHP